MKAKAASLLVVILLTTTQCMAQRRITVEAQSYDISNNLDLQAVASVFGESRNLRDFEMRLNDFDNQISNLDLNDDGDVDYLRVIETSENRVHLVVIQAVLGRNDYQDVATIVVERTSNRRTYVQVIGDPYLYGRNYIVEPIFYYTPSIYSYFWGREYSRWVSPYYWGYYPRYYHNRRPCEVNIYVNHVHTHINRDHRYYYTDNRRGANVDRLYNSVRRNDYSKQYPDRNFNSRNENARNKQELDRERGDKRALETRTPGRGNDESVRRGNDSRSTNGGSQNTSPAVRTNPGSTQRSTGSGTYTPSTTRRSSESTDVSRPKTEPRQSTSESRPATTTRSSNSERSTPAASQPSRSSEPRQSQRSTTESRSSSEQPERGSRSSETNSTNRR